eukprot:TRINITY_DN40323_c0_g1_i1.p1 TRINITY_DN40323_c0_g1~~TRINITY_DN40323_c0_g1_i1.p1  ORF type:complete len:514 (-),score=73.42 TRINITY_DN40323_c0_g1_i1:368-1909(-)
MPQDGKYVLAIDQGTSSSRAILFDRDGHAAHTAQSNFPQYNPRPGWTEHDPMEILKSVDDAVNDVLKAAGATSSDVAAVGITNQRETTVAWDRLTGRPLHKAIVWLDTRTADIVERLKSSGGQDRFRATTGLPLSTYFSAVKIMWLIENVPAVAAAVAEGRCMFGTIDCWLVYNLTGGPSGGLFITDVSNASRYMLMDIESLKWDAEICQALGIPISCLPEIRSNAEVLGRVTVGPLEGAVLTSPIGDQHAALLGQGCLQTGQVKVTYGTGCFILVNIGSASTISKSGLLTTVGYKLGRDAPVVYALEGSVAVAGLGTKWLRDNLKLFKATKNMDQLAGSVPDAGGVTFVPAFSGLLAPHWRPDARGALVGLSLQTTSAHVARAMREGVAFQVCDVVHAMERETGVPLSTLRVDGGMSGSDLSMQINADVIGVPLLRAKEVEATAFGAAFAAGLAVGVWSKPADVLKAIEGRGSVHHFEPRITAVEREAAQQRWKSALASTLGLGAAVERSKL